MRSGGGASVASFGAMPADPAMGACPACRAPVSDSARFDVSRDERQFARCRNPACGVLTLVRDGAGGPWRAEHPLSYEDG
jgi:hypothetical protein